MTTIIPAPDVLARVTLTSGDRLFVNEAEAELGRFIGQKRFAVNQHRNAQACLEQDPLVILSNHQGGAIAEVAVASRLNLYPMLQFKEYFDYNLRLAGGDLVQVNWDAKRRACIVDEHTEARRRKKKKESPDLHIVVTGEIDQLTFVGWCTHTELLAAQPLEPLKYGLAYVQRALHPQLQILTCYHGQGWRGGLEPGLLIFED